MVFAPLESFPSGIRFSLHQAEGRSGGQLSVEGDPPVDFQNIVSVCLDGYSIVAGGEGLSEEDQQYRNTESWAALVALFRCLSQNGCLVANHVVERDHFHSRLSELYLLHSYGLPVPRTLVSSDAAQVRAFVEQVKNVIYRPVMGKDLPFRPLLPEDIARLDEVGLAPVHFEESSPGTLVGCLRVGSHTFISPRDADVPKDLQAGFAQLSDDLGLHLAEMRLRFEPDQGWLAVGLHPFLTMEGMRDPEVVQAALQMLETGVPA